MVNENEIDWTVARKNLNPKTKQPYKRGRNWVVVVYPESAPENWIDLIRQEPVAISPLHDKDVDENGERKKPHYHVVFAYKGNKSFEQIDEIARLLHAPIPQRVNSLTGQTRYLTHQDNPEKYQYESSDIQVFGGFDLEGNLAMSSGDKRQILKDMILFIREENIIHLVDLTDYCLSENAPAGWFEILTERNTLFLKELIKSNWQKSKEN
ncbi:TPA: replication protein RepB [Listeria monocytogenes]|uniref:replication protein n=1 Tax=Bacilli TaxID=91061 RepID=UPI000D0B78C4|nr:MULTISPECIES: replication protein [Bacilli]EAE9930578.1 replication protein RepB [Listeria monocytogenes]EAK9772081.1 replication protein RepB [Listeria monocytogenes]EDN9085802.1 replication protein RepB [Listeria monocytogenes]EJW3591138.1 replication protein [Listeria monocytogenes]EJW3602044.1 replication protein [Listeria monocytogenes]